MKEKNPYKYRSPIGGGIKGGGDKVRTIGLACLVILKRIPRMLDSVIAISETVALT